MMNQKQITTFVQMIESNPFGVVLLSITGTLVSFIENITPLFQFLAVFCGSMIALITLVQKLRKIIIEIKKEEEDE